MANKCIAAVILAVALFGWPAFGQSIADLFQKGIYTQETVGDLDGAIKIYRQIINAGTEAHGYAAQALYRLGLCLQAKGDSAGAIQAFQKLVKDYPDEKELAAKAQQYLPAAVRDPFLGFSFVVPPRWMVALPESLSGGWDDVRMYDPEGQATYAGVVAIGSKPGDPETYFRSRPESWRQYTEASKENWMYRPESIRRFQVGGREAQSLVADYTEGGQRKVEFVTWVPSENIRLAIYAWGIDPENVDSFLKRFHPIVDSLVVP